jgi:hypothetical protein
MVVDEEDDEVQNENDIEILEGNDINDELAPSDSVDYEIVDSDDETYDPANPDTYMKIIFNHCNAIFFISHMFLNTSFLYVLISILLIAGCWTKMVGSGRRMRSGRRSTCRTVEEAQRDDDI